MSIEPSLALSAVLTLVAIFCGWRGARAPDLLRGPRLVPWRLLMVTAGAAAVLIGVAALKGAQAAPSVLAQ